MRSRFPHGGEVLGAAPANPILAPVLSKDLSLSISRQRDLLDLQAIQRIPGLVGYWKSDPQYLFEDSAGTTPASTNGTGPVGQWRPLGSPMSFGEELVDTLNEATAWTTGGANTLALDGDALKAVFVDHATAGIASLVSAGGLTTDLVIGNTYLITGQAKVSASGAVTINATNTSGVSVSQGAFTLTSSDYVGFEIVFTATQTNNQLRVTSFSSGESVWWKSLSIRQVITNAAFQATTTNKPILRKTPTTGVYWADSNTSTSTSALTVALGNLGSACTVARASAEGVTFTENVSITSTYNIAPAFSFNADVAIFNRALTATEKALIARYMARAVPMLGSNVVTNGTFDTNTTGWTNTANSVFSVVGGWARLQNDGSGSRMFSQVMPSASKFYFATASVRGDGNYGKPRFSLGVVAYVDGTVSTGDQTVKVTAAPAGTTIGMYCSTSVVSGPYIEADNITAKEIL